MAGGAAQAYAIARMGPSRLWTSPRPGCDFRTLPDLELGHVRDTERGVGAGSGMPPVSWHFLVQR